MDKAHCYLPSRSSQSISSGFESENLPEVQGAVGGHDSGVACASALNFLDVTFLTEDRGESFHWKGLLWEGNI